MDKKILIVLGRGVEGCGITMSAVQMQRVLGCDVIASSDKQWPRKNGIKFNYTEFNFAREWEKVAHIANVYDLVIVFSLPSKSHSEECQQNFLKLLDAISVRKVIINGDHKIASITRNANLKESCEKVDVLITHSLNNAFSKKVRDLGVKTPIREMGVGLDYDSHRAKYWVPVSEQRPEIIRWIGRTAMWKGPDLLIDFQESHLMRAGFISILEGLEASINYRLVLYRDKGEGTRRKVVNYFRPEKEHGETAKFSRDLYGKETTDNPAYLYPAFVNDECMQRLARSGFGSNLYHLGPDFHANNNEYCHAEVVASGAVPVFHKYFCDTVIHKKQGVPVSECVNSGTIGLDYTNFDEVRDLMVKLRDDSIMRDEWREMAFEFWKQHSDAKDVFDEILDVAFNTQPELEEKVGVDSWF